MELTHNEICNEIVEAQKRNEVGDEGYFAASDGNTYEFFTAWDDEYKDFLPFLR